nr:Nuclear hormone receptor HR96 [Hymenolepis microstoma]
MTSRKRVLTSQMNSVIQDDHRCFAMGTNSDNNNCPPTSSSLRRDEKTCAVCGDHAFGFNFGAIACESCKAFFRRNALRASMPPCLFNDSCMIQVKTRRFCSPCRLSKCFAVGMRKSCIMDEKAKRERREKIQRNRERKVASIQKGATGAGGDGGGGGGGGVVASASPICYHGSTGSPNSSEYQHPPHPMPSDCSSSFYPMMPTGAPVSNCGAESHPVTLEGDVSIGSSSGSWQMSQGMHQNQMLSMGGYPPHHLHNAPPSMIMPSAPSDIHQQQPTSFSGMESTAYSHDPTHDITSTGDWLQMMTSSKSVEDTNSTLPYYVKKSGTTAILSPKNPPSNMNGDCKSGVKNVLDGHVWTLEPEDPSNKECIALCPNFLKTGMARLLSKHQWTALNDLRSAYETSFLDSAFDHAPESSSNITISSLVNTSGFLVRKFINFAKKLADFSVLGQEGQICLLKGVVLNALFIRSASHYDVVKDVWLTPKGEIPTSILRIATGLQNLYEEHAKYCRNFADVVRKDSHLVALMQVLCLFAPDRPRLSDRQSVSNIYDRYILLLKHYLEARHGFTRGRTLLAAVLTNLAELQALTDNYGHILLHVDPSKVDPLVLEVFNLSDRGKGSSKNDEDDIAMDSPLIPLDHDTSSKNNTDPTEHRGTTHKHHVQSPPENSTTFAADHPSGTDTGNQFQDLPMDHILSE